MRVAFLDLDHTLLAADSNQLWMAYLRSEQLISEEQSWVHDQFLRDYACGQLHFADLQDFRIGLDASLSPVSLSAVRAVFEREILIPAIAPLAPRLLAELAQRGLTTVLVSATRSPLVDPVAQVLGVDHAITSCFGRDKVKHVQAWLQSLGSSLNDLQESWFFSDSHNDLPLLDVVMHPVAVDADDRLQQVAIERAWPMMSLRSEVSWGDLLLPPALAPGLKSSTST
jgi:HAD superfamily phosphoserine phosphatase-like hydrolase